MKSIRDLFVVLLLAGALGVAVAPVRADEGLWCPDPDLDEELEDAGICFPGPCPTIGRYLQ
jgi:hypothetical protein